MCVCVCSFVCVCVRVCVCVCVCVHVCVCVWYCTYAQCVVWCDGVQLFMQVWCVVAHVWLVWLLWVVCLQAGV